MHRRNLLIFLAAAAVSLGAAVYRFDDSAHAVGLVRPGSEARHAAVFGAGRDRCTLIVTGTVLPPYRGDARVVLENLSGYDYALHGAGPTIDIGLHRRPQFADGILRDLQPRDRFALWLVLKRAATTAGPPPADPSSAPALVRNHGAGPALAFYDVQSGAAVLRVPIRMVQGGATDVH